MNVEKRNRMSVDEKNRMSIGEKNVRSAPDRQPLRLIEVPCFHT